MKLNRRTKNRPAMCRGAVRGGLALIVPALVLAACSQGNGTTDARVDAPMGDTRTDARSDARADAPMPDMGMDPPDNRMDPPDMGMDPPDMGMDPPDVVVPPDEPAPPDMGGPPDDVVTVDMGMMDPDVVTPPVDEGPPPDTGCPGVQVMCGGSCVDVDTSSAHCGRCDNACASGQSCVAGACRIACAAPRTVCGAGEMQTCVDTNTDTMNCGACGTVCAGGTNCVMGACQCPSGQTDCMGTCRNLQTDTANCGTCGNACAMGEMCNAGVCGTPCAAPNSRCGTGDTATCVNLQTDLANCGMCGRACAAEQSCNMGTCACTSGRTACTAMGSRPAGCFDTQTDEQHCGNCATVCPDGQNCLAGTCRAAPPTNDRPTGAIDIPLAQPTVSLSVNMGGSASDTSAPAGCASAVCTTSAMTGADVFYRFTLTRAEIVYLNTFGSAFDTILFLKQGSPTALTDVTAVQAGGAGFNACNDDQGTVCGSGTGFSTLDSRIVARLNPGTYYVVVKACTTSGTGRATLNMQHLPVGNGPATNIAPAATMANTMGNTSGTGVLAGSCGSSAVTSAENTLWWTTCPNFTAQRFHATSCNSGTSFDTVLYQRSANRAAEVCVDDSSFDCSTRSSLTSDLAAGSGLHAVYVDGYSGAMGSYNVTYRLGSCAAGYTLCGSTCLQTTRLQTDNANCGACGTVCGAGTTCSAGVCRPSNNECATAQTITLGAPGTTTTVMGNLFNATDSANSPRADRNDVWFQFTTTQRELIYIDTFGTTSVDTVVAAGNACGSAAVARDDDSGCGASCGTGTTGCAFNNSQLAMIVDPGTHYIVVDSYTNATGTSVPFTLNIQRLSGIAGGVGGILGDVVASGVVGVPAGNYSLAGNTGLLSLMPSRVHACGTGGTPSAREHSFYWATCPGFTAANFTARTCTAASFDTVLELRSTRQSGTDQAVACEDDSPATCSTSNRSAISTMLPAGAALYQLQLTGYSGASGTATITGTRP